MPRGRLRTYARDVATEGLRSFWRVLAFLGGVGGVTLIGSATGIWAVDPLLLFLALTLTLLLMLGTGQYRAWSKQFGLVQAQATRIGGLEAALAAERDERARRTLAVLQTCSEELDGWHKQLLRAMARSYYHAGDSFRTEGRTGYQRQVSANPAYVELQKRLVDAYGSADDVNQGIAAGRATTSTDKVNLLGDEPVFIRVIGEAQSAVQREIDRLVRELKA